MKQILTVIGDVGVVLAIPLMPRPLEGYAFFPAVYMLVTSSVLENIYKKYLTAEDEPE